MPPCWAARCSPPCEPEELDEILKFASERRVRRGQTIFQRGDNGSSMMAVLRGRVRISSVSGDGKEVTLNVISPGEIFGEFALLDGKPRSNDAAASEDTLLLVVERRHFLPFLAQNQDLTLRLLAVLCDKLRRTSMALEEIALFDLPVRLARVLLKLAEDYGRPSAAGTRIDLKLSQRDLSNLVASSRESVNKQLRAWRENGCGRSGGRLHRAAPAGRTARTHRRPVTSSRGDRRRRDIDTARCKSVFWSHANRSLHCRGAGSAAGRAGGGRGNDAEPVLRHQRRGAAALPGGRSAPRSHHRLCSGLDHAGVDLAAADPAHSRSAITSWHSTRAVRATRTRRRLATNLAGAARTSPN